MTSKENPSTDDKAVQNLEEICENTRAIRRVVNRIFDHLHEYGSKDEDEHYGHGYDPDSISWHDLDNGDDVYM
jgi:hypothetical protein